MLVLSPIPFGPGICPAPWVFPLWACWFAGTSLISLLPFWTLSFQSNEVIDGAPRGGRLRNPPRFSSFSISLALPSAPSWRAGHGHGAAHLRRRWIGAKQAPRYQLTNLKVEGQTRAHTLLRHKWGYAVKRASDTAGCGQVTAMTPHPLWLCGDSISQWFIVENPTSELSMDWFWRENFTGKPHIMKNGKIYGFCTVDFPLNQFIE